MYIIRTLAALFAVLSFSSTATATEHAYENVIRVPLTRKSFIAHPRFDSSPDHNPRSLVTRVKNAAGHVNVDFLKADIVCIAM